MQDTSDGGEQDAERWIESFATALEARAGVPLGAGLTAPGSQQQVLPIARAVAHGTVRRNAPLATFVVGSYVLARRAQGVDLAAALDEAAAVAAELAG